MKKQEKNPSIYLEALKSWCFGVKVRNFFSTSWIFFSSDLLSLQGFHGGGGSHNLITTGRVSQEAPGGPPPFSTGDRGRRSVSAISGSSTPACLPARCVPGSLAAVVPLRAHELADGLEGLRHVGGRRRGGGGEGQAPAAAPTPKGSDPIHHTLPT